MKTETKSPIASESEHWYDKQGAPVYEVTCKSKEGTRPTNIGDGRKLDLAPSFTKIKGEIAAPGLNAYWENMLLDSALTLPVIQGENADARKKRIREDAKEHSRKARERGTELHKAIEDYIRGIIAPEWKEHLILLDKMLEQHGIDLSQGDSEHSFASQIDGNWYGGKIDYHIRANSMGDPSPLRDPAVVLDFKSKEKIEPKKQLIWDEHSMQISAYGYGLFGRITSSKPWDWEAFRGLNVFVGVTDCEVRIHEHTSEDLEHAFELFRSILDFWTRKNKFGKYSKEKK